RVRGGTHIADGTVRERGRAHSEAVQRRISAALVAARLATLVASARVETRRGILRRLAAVLRDLVKIRVGRADLCVRGGRCSGPAGLGERSRRRNACDGSWRGNGG